LPILTIINKT